jgi:hypothetical protein
MGNEPGIFYFAFRLFLNFGAIASPWFHVFFVESRFTDRHLFDTRTVESHYSGVDKKMRSLLCCQSNIALAKLTLGRMVFDKKDVDHPRRGQAPSFD